MNALIILDLRACESFRSDSFILNLALFTFHVHLFGEEDDHMRSLFPEKYLSDNILILAERIKRSKLAAHSRLFHDFDLVWLKNHVCSPFSDHDPFKRSSQSDDDGYENYGRFPNSLFSEPRSSARISFSTPTLWFIEFLILPTGRLEMMMI